jgi:RHH-type proline utilization regulon transcriptional repressor/proline dehydrogenase/delta 1-pyrroline-5-carboxylate dehydrogenase
VLHLVRYQRHELGALLDRINATGYGLTQGLHTRIDETIGLVTESAQAGNLYVNRNMVGAVVGVQPFGGVGLSGTGPKAGGPLYLFRLLSSRPGAAPAQALARLAQEPSNGPLHVLRRWAQDRAQSRLASACAAFGAQSPGGATVALPGPTGERNVYRTMPRARVLCLAADDDDLLVQLAAVLAVATRAVWPAAARTLLQRLPGSLQADVELVADWSGAEARFDIVLLHGDAAAQRSVCRQLAGRPGPIVGVVGLAPGASEVPLERLVIERCTSINTAAAGGNASLMTIG